MPERDQPTGSSSAPLSERLDASAQAIIADDVAQTAATGRLKKRGISPPIVVAEPSRAGCSPVLIVIALIALLVVGVGLAALLSGGIGGPSDGTNAPTGSAAAPSGTVVASAPPSTSSSGPPVAGGPVLSAPDPTGDTVTDSRAPVSDATVDITKISIQKIGDRYRVVVELADGFTLTFSFAVLLEIGSDTAASSFIWQTHGDPPELLIGRLDPETGSIIAGEADGVVITRDPASGTVTFEFGVDQIPAGTDRLRVSSFHKAAEADIERNTDVTTVLDATVIICGGTCRP